VASETPATGLFLCEQKCALLAVFKSFGLP